MDVITNVGEITENLATIENYLCEGSREEQDFAVTLIKKGVCFITYKINNEYRFSPSRFVGYSKNNITTHNLGKKNKKVDGKETNPAIDAALGHKSTSNSKLESEYLSFTSNLGISPDNRKRKFWEFCIDLPALPNTPSTDEGFPEGKIVERKHLARERSSSLSAKAKEQFLKKEGKLFCIICGFNFEEKYGDRGAGFIEAHHTIPVSQMAPGQKTKISDIALVCSNCHGILHRSRPWLSVNELKLILKQ